MSAPDLPNKLPAKGFVFLFWICLLASMTLLFNGFIVKRDNPNHALIADAETKTVVLQRNRAGHYVAPGEVNGYPVTFLLDTGATDVSIPSEIANVIGLEPSGSVAVNTANGVVSVYQTMLNEVQLGGIKMLNVRANINPHSNGDIVLLGMSFMKHLEMMQKDRILTLSIP